MKRPNKDDNKNRETTSLCIGVHYSFINFSFSYQRKKEKDKKKKKKTLFHIHAFVYNKKFVFLELLVFFVMLKYSDNLRLILIF